MRINVYAEEITKDTEMMQRSKRVAGRTKRFYGCRIYMATPNDLVGSDRGEDIRPAVTFWFNEENKDVCQRLADAVAGALRGMVR